MGLTSDRKGQPWKESVGRLTGIAHELGIHTFHIDSFTRQPPTSLTRHSDPQSNTEP